MSYFENIDEPQSEVTKRPVFLTVLCILTFVGAGLGILGGIYGLFANQEAALQASIDSMSHTPKGAAIAEAMAAGKAEYFKWQTISNYLSLVSSFMCLAGALLMWKQKRSGFYLYLPGEIMPIIGMIGSYMVVQSVPLIGITTLLTIAFMSLVYIVFIIMYGVNLKHMR